MGDSTQEQSSASIDEIERTLLPMAIAFDEMLGIEPMEFHRPGSRADLREIEAQLTAAPSRRGPPALSPLNSVGVETAEPTGAEEVPEDTSMQSEATSASP